MSRTVNRGRRCSECPAPAVKRGMCSAHYQAWRTHQPPRLTTPICTIEGCTMRHHARGWCSTHYQRWRAHGDPHVRLKGYRHHRRRKPEGRRLSTIRSVRLPTDIAAKVDYKAASDGLTTAAWLRQHLTDLVST